jgi:hypothetical protein
VHINTVLNYLGEIYPKFKKLENMLISCSHTTNTQFSLCILGTRNLNYKNKIKQKTGDIGLYRIAEEILTTNL